MILGFEFLIVDFEDEEYTIFLHNDENKSNMY